MDFIKIIVYFAIIFSIGLLFIKSFLKNLDLTLSISILWGLSSGVISILLFYVLFFKMIMNINIILLFILISLSIAYFYQNRIFDVDRIKLPKKINFSNVELYLLLFIFFNVIVVLMRSIFLPITGVDFIQNWGYKSNIIFQHGSIWNAFFLDREVVHMHADYPLLIPIINAVFYLFIGQVDDVNVKLNYFFFFISILMFLFYAGSRTINKVFGFILVSLYCTIPSVTRFAQGGIFSGYSDIPLSYYMVVLSYLSISYILEQDIKILFLITLFSSFLILSKNEGMYFYFINLVLFILFLFKKQKRRPERFKCIILLVPLIVSLPFFIFRHFVPRVGENYLQILDIEVLISNLNRVSVILGFWWREFFLKFWRSGLIGIFFIISTIYSIYSRKIWRFEVYYLTSLLIAYFIILFSAYLVTPWDLPSLISATITRIDLQLFPLILLIIAFQLKDTKFHDKIRERFTLI
jgi:hypothetical protein